MQRTRLLTTAIAFATVLLTVACSGNAAETASSAPSTTSDGKQAVMLTVGNGMSFDPSTVTVRAGQPVQLTLHNTGLMPHDFTLADGLGQPVKITVTGGQTAVATFTLDKPGTYSFLCSMPGHAAAGMRGTITAQ